MKYNVNVYQVVLEDINVSRKKAQIFTKCMLGSTPTIEEFNNFYENVLSLELDSNIEDIMDVCERCFSILNSENIDTIEDVKEFNIIKPCRSLSAGDILEVNNELYLVKMIGFSKFSEVSAKETNIFSEI